MSNEETHDTVISPMAPSYCRNCGLSGAELRWNPCPKQKPESDSIGVQERLAALKEPSK